MKAHYDAIVVGAGPGGCSAAYYLNQNGYDVLLIDKQKFPRDKFCGDGIGLRSLKMFEDMDVLRKIETGGFQPINGLRMSSPNGSSFTSPAQRGYVAPRNQLDYIVLNHVVDNGVNFEVVNVNAPITNERGVCGISGRYGGDIREIKADIVIAADGALSQIARCLGMINEDSKHFASSVRTYYDNVEDIEDKIELHYDTGTLPGYAWIFPTGPTTANVGVGIHSADLKKSGKSISDIFESFVRKNKFANRKLKNARKIQELRGWQLPMGSGAGRNYSDGVLFVGDAGSFIDPLTGEGISYALETGKMAAIIASDALSSGNASSEMLSAYETLWTSQLTKDYKDAFKLEKIMRYGFVVNKVVKAASKDPIFARKVTDVIGNAAKKGTIMDMATTLKILFA